MPILLRRVDERLIHGQVVVGWGRRTDPDHFLVVDDELAASAWEQELYLLAVDDADAEASFRSVEEARAEWSGWEEREERVILLTRDPETMRRLAEGGTMPAGAAINLGGLHAGPGRAQVRPWLHLTETDRAAIRALADEGLEVTGRDLPDTTAVDLDELLDA